MPKYNYRALNDKGRPIRGVVNAASEPDLLARLEEGGLTLIDCREVDEKSSRIASLFAKKVKIRELIQVFIHMEQLQKAGVPLLDALGDVRGSTDSPRLRDVMSEVHREVADGSSFSQALGKFPGVFHPIVLALIHAGEETGSLTGSFAQVIKHLKWTDAMQTKIKKATRYPKILIAVVMMVIWVMMGYVVPQVTGFLKEMGKELPAVTLALIATSEFVTNYFLYIIAAILGGIVFVRIASATSESFRYRVDYLFLRLPLIGPVSRKISLSQFCQTFGVLFASGMDILKCLDAAKNTAGNLAIIEALQTVRQRVQEGSPLSVALENSGEFPSMVTRMIRIGEESGNLTNVLDQVSEFYDKDVNESVDGMIMMIEPILTGFLGGTVLWISAAVFGPIYDSLGSMGG